MEGVAPHLLPLFHSFAQVREDLARWTSGLSREAVWTPIAGSSLGFQLRHIAGSVDRLGTYLMGGVLSEQQMAALRGEGCGTADIEELLATVEHSLRACESAVRSIDPDTLQDARRVGRKALPTTVLGLLVHIAEHTQRHLGQAILIAKILRQMD
jgi:hypothetical protein